MTTMFDRYFGIPQDVMRSGLWAQMKGCERNLYVCLMHESERCSTREIQRTDAVMCNLAGMASRTFCYARKKLQERGLVVCRRGRGNIYVYTVCNPETRLPWPGNPKERIPYRRKDRPALSNHNSAPPIAQTLSVIPASPVHELRAPESYGMPLKFGR